MSFKTIEKKNYDTELFFRDVNFIIYFITSYKIMSFKRKCNE